MKRFATVVSVLSILLLASSALAGPTGSQYGWTLSASSTNPFANSAAPTGGLATLYLWYVCSGDTSGMGQPVIGISAAEFDLTATPLAAPTVQNGWINLATQPTQWLAIIGQCPDGPMVAASILYLDAAGIEVCVMPSVDNSFNISVDCDQNPFPHSFVGFSSTANPPCTQENGAAMCAATIATAPESWGGIKSLYR